MKLYTVPSFSNPRKTYIVRKMDDDTWRCGCPAFIIKEHQIGVCKHIKKAMDYETQKNNNRDTSVDNSDFTSRPNFHEKSHIDSRNRIR